MTIIIERIRIRRDIEGAETYKLREVRRIGTVEFWIPDSNHLTRRSCSEVCLINSHKSSRY